MLRYFRLLRDNPEFSKLWFASVVSLTGDWFSTVVLSAMVVEFSDGSAVAISLFLALRALPPLILSPFAGVILDRFNRQHILIASNLLRALIVPLYLLAYNAETLWIIYAVTIAQFTLSSVFEPGQAAILPALVKPTDIIEGNTLFSVTWSVMLALGAIFGGVFAYFFGGTAALIADAFTFLLAGLLIWWVQYDPQMGRKLAKELNIDPRKEEDTSFVEGLRYIRKTPQIAAALFVKFGQSFGNIDTLLTVFGTQIFIMGAKGELSLGIFYSALGLGALIGPILSNFFNDGSVKQMRRLMSLGFITMIFSWLVLGWAGSLAVVAIAIFIRAMGGSINWTYSNVLIQKTAPDAKLGRMFSIDMLGYYTSTLISAFVHGYLIDVLGVEKLDWVIWGTLAFSLIPTAIWLWVVPRLEAIEENQSHIVVATGD